jgi:hypothetical protein
MFGFAPTASLDGRGEKQCETYESLSQTRGYIKSTCFSRVVALLNSVGVYVKGCRVRLVMGVYMSCVSGFSYRMYIDSNHRNSQI